MERGEGAAPTLAERRRGGDIECEQSKVPDLKDPAASQAQDTLRRDDLERQFTTTMNEHHDVWAGKDLRYGTYTSILTFLRDNEQKQRQ